MALRAVRPWGVYDIGGMVAVSLRCESHDISSTSCPCGPKVIEPSEENEFTRPLLLHRSMAFAGVRIPDAWPSEGATR